jgi:hypothetical protein
MSRISIDQMLQAGLILAGYNQKQRNRQYSQLINWFKSNYGSHPHVYCVVWDRLEPFDDERKLKYFLMTLSWFKNYDTEAILAGRFNLDEKTIRLWCAYYTECLDELCEERIKLPGDWGAETFVGVVDGTHCRCYKPSHPEFPFDPSYKSFKLGKDGLAYEVMLNMRGLPIWINGPFPAGTPDINIFNDKLAGLVLAGKLVLGDKGYRGPDICCTPNSYDSYRVMEFKRKHRARMEQYNGRLKNFRILEDVFRVKGAGRLEKHRMIFGAVNAIVEAQLTTGFPLFDP